MIPLIIVIIVCVISAGVVISIVVNRSDRTADPLNDRIMHDLNDSGYQVIEVKTPGSLGKRPSSKSRTGFHAMKPLKGSKQERTRYRIVRYIDNKGVVRQSWVRIHSTAMEKEKVTWLPEI